MIFYEEIFHKNEMNSIISENNQATEDIFTHHVLPYFSYKDLQCSSMINQTIEEYSYETFIDNIEDFSYKGLQTFSKVNQETEDNIEDTYYENTYYDSPADNFMKRHRNLVGIYIWVKESLTSLLKPSCLHRLKINYFSYPTHDQNFLKNLTNINYLEINCHQPLNSDCFEMIINLISPRQNLTHLIMKKYTAFTPKCFDNLVNLTHLRLQCPTNFNGKFFDKLVNLTHLEINDIDNGITDESFDNLVNLTHLKLNKWKKLTSRCIHNLVNLVYLYMDVCIYESKNGDFDKLVNLTHLKIIEWYNKIDDKCFVNLVNLQYLYIECDWDWTSDNCFDKLANLKYLSINRFAPCQPPEIHSPKLKNLEYMCVDELIRFSSYSPDKLKRFEHLNTCEWFLGNYRIQ